jgi:O-antigen/teichoic acid export membrane protein
MNNIAPPPKDVALSKSGKFGVLGTSMIWNLASLVFLVVAGLGLNVAIGRLYGPEDLGVFNICFAAFIFLSQVGTFGTQFSILQAVSEHFQTDRETSSLAINAGFIVVLMATTLTTLVGLLATPLLVELYKAESTRLAWLCLLPGLWAFSVNKYLFGVINGAQMMKTFAVLQALRYAFILASLAGLYLLKAEGKWLTLVLTFGEIVLLPILVWAATKAVGAWRFSKLAQWPNWHVSFGARAFLSGAILELNTRIDVLIVGALIGATQAGIYSVALLVAEGVGQFLFVIRNVINPRISEFLAKGDEVGLTKLSKMVAALAWPAMTVICIVAWFVFPYFIDIAMGGGAYHQGATALAILLVGVVVATPGQIMGMILALAKRPGMHTIMVSCVLATNAILNFVLVPKFGINGSAMATATAYIVGAILVSLAARHILKVRLFL